MDNTQNPAPVSSSAMSDEDKMTQAIASSYVDDYTPPTTPVTQAPQAAQDPVAAVPAPVSMPTPSMIPSTPMPVMPTPPAPAATPMTSAYAPLAASQPMPVSTPMPVMPSAPTMSTDASASSESEDTSDPIAPVATDVSAPSSVSQTLEDQNIFALLGLESATDDDKEAFLDELQQIIWEDFLENDVELLITEDEMVEFKKISAKEGLSEEDKQSEMITFLEKLIPDLEKIMLEKALELKEEMFRERITSMKETFADRADVQASVQKALDLIASQQWRAAADELNTIK